MIPPVSHKFCRRGVQRRRFYDRINQITAPRRFHTASAIWGGMPMEHYSSSVQETEALGRALAQHLTPGTVVAFTGGLGGGQNRLCPGHGPGVGALPSGSPAPPLPLSMSTRGGGFPSFTSTCTGWAAQMTSLTSVGRISSAGGASVPWSGARPCKRPWTPTPSTWTSVGALRTTSGCSPSEAPVLRTCLWERKVRDENF